MELRGYLKDKKRPTGFAVPKDGTHYNIIWMILGQILLSETKSATV